MKKISASYWIFAALCFLWGCVDLYHYVVIGPGVIENHEGIHSVQQLVNNSLWMGLIKILLTVAILAAGWFMGKRREKSSSPALLSYFTRRVGLVLLGLWLLTMSLLTVGTAQYVLGDIVETSAEYPGFAGKIGRLDECFPIEEGTVPSPYRQQPGGIDYCMLDIITSSSIYNSPPSLDHYSENFFWDGIYSGHSKRLNTAIVFLDSEENVLHQSGNFFFFDYLTAESWAAGEDGTDGYAWIDLSDEDDERFTFMRPQNTGLHPLFWSTIRMTGYFDGSRFEPLSMALGNKDDISSLSFPRADALGRVQWDVCFDHSADAPAGTALVTIYAQSPYSMAYQDKPIRYQGQAYDDLLTLARNVGYSYNHDLGSHVFRQNNSQYNLFNSVFFGAHDYYDLSDYDFSSGKYWPAPVITMITAVQASPLLIAMENLLAVYLVTGVLALAAFFWLRSLWKEHVAVPLQTVNSGIAEGWVHLPGYQYTPPELTEPRELVEHYRSTQQRLYGYKNETARLNTALTYAKTAEENRRQMTSHIAHELKTPLAVIHSYTEALQERIAEEKRDQYLSVILAETERMDSMVLEMLDLSRLEAGRVKLAQDEFSLLEMTKDIFARLEMALQAKNLQVTYQCYFDAMVTADEGRIRQVVENFATNAVKHTPPDGEIRVHIYADRQGTVFSMENDGEQLPAEVLGKVWDSFWRQDESRTSPGTGLGLAIAKGIITLHGGECSAHNTKRGVEFRFRI